MHTHLASSDQPITVDDNQRRTLGAVEQALTRERGGNLEHATTLIGPQGEVVELPTPVADALKQIVHYLARGQAVTLAPVESELTTQQAADLLNVSRPYLIKLLEDGRISFTKTGTHRRIRLSDVLVYKEQRDSERRRGLAELARLSQEFGEDD